MKANEDLYLKVFEKILNFISYSPRTEKEVKDRINRFFGKKDISPQEKDIIIEKVMAELRDLRLLDDLLYAKDYVQGRIRSEKPVSKRKLAEFLYKKGVSREIIDQVTVEYSDELEYSAAEKLADKKLRSIKDTDPFVIKRKLTGYLLSKGFSPQIVYIVVDTKTKVQ
jgi:regulatory protein